VSVPIAGSNPALTKIPEWWLQIELNDFALAHLEKVPRVPVTPSMLYTYAHLRGNKDKKKEDGSDDHHRHSDKETKVYDPLHHALYPTYVRNPDSDELKERCWVPLITRRLSMEEYVSKIFVFNLSLFLS